MTIPTGKKPASDAGKILGSPKSGQKDKTVAASDLTQAPKKSGQQKKK